MNYPACYDSVIAVAAVDRNNKVASFSSRGPEVEFAAGGVDVYMCYKNNGYAAMSGTSFSAPVISGIACLIKAIFRAKGIELSPQELRDRLKKIAYDVGPAGRDELYGNGIPVFTKDAGNVFNDGEAAALFCMGNAQDPEKGCPGDWAVIEGPQAHFWGGTWMLAANGTDNADLVADIMKAFTVDEETVSNLVAKEGQYPNNKKVAAKYAEDPNFANAFLGGQNDVAVFSAMTDNIKWENHTIYDQQLNEGLQNKLQEFYKGAVSKEEAMNNFYNYVSETFKTIVINK